MPCAHPIAKFRTVAQFAMARLLLHDAPPFLIIFLSKSPFCRGVKCRNGQENFWLARFIREMTPLFICLYNFLLETTENRCFINLLLSLKSFVERGVRNRRCIDCRSMSCDMSLVMQLNG
jgi:hypothetical protein